MSKPEPVVVVGTLPIEAYRDGLVREFYWKRLHKGCAIYADKEKPGWTLTDKPCERTVN